MREGGGRGINNERFLLFFFCKLVLDDEKIQTIYKYTDCRNREGESGCKRDEEIKSLELREWKSIHWRERLKKDR